MDANAQCSAFSTSVGRRPQKTRSLSLPETGPAIEGRTAQGGIYYSVF